MSLISKFVSFVKYMAYLIFVSFLLLEITFNFLPVSDSLKSASVNEQEPVLKFAKNRKVNKQIGSDFSHVITKHINNYGYATDNNFDVTREIDKPLVAIVGDSYVEAIQVRNEHSFHGVLSSSYQEMDFYPIGVGGSPLSQYVAFAKFASEEFSPNAYIFIVIENDFDQSFFRYKGSPGFHYFSSDGGLERVDYSPTALEVVARKSAFLRYLILDLKIRFQFENLKKRWVNGDAEKIEKNTVRYKPSQSRIDDAKYAIDIFLTKMEEIVNGKPVLFVVDGDRRSIYNGGIERNMDRFYNISFGYFLDKASGFKKFTVLDMHPIFLRHWFQFERSFNFKYDFHWNRLGHKIVAESISETLFFKDIQNILNER
ncbi:MAG: hypothetical protein ABJI96_09315 [Paracoccaceae bacterium]